MADSEIVNGVLRHTRVLFLALLWLQNEILSAGASESVYFDKYGHCTRSEPFDLADEDYTLKPVAGTFIQEAKFCDITFKAPANYGVCLIFDEFEIDDCSVRLKVYLSESASGTAWTTLDCHSDKPNKICTSNRFITVQVAKDKLNENRGYDFEIEVTKTMSVSGEEVLFASIGVVMGVILGVMVLIAVVAVTFIYCCCKRRKQGKGKNIQPSGQTTHDNLVQPSAPPLEDHHDPPPPYTAPPPYAEHGPLMELSQPTNYEQSYGVK